MKKLLAVTLLFLAVNCTAYAQDESTAYYQGSSTISAGYGIGNIWKKLFKLSGAFSGGKYDVSASGPYTLIYEYGVSDKISAGVSLGYSKVEGDYSDASNYKYTETLTNISALARANYHFGQSEKFDPYLGLGLGYYNFKYEYKDNDTNPNTTTFAVPSAFGLSAQLGAKYYIASSFGLFAEVGYVAGSYAQVGLTARF
jgi:outer membrane protein W